MKLSEIIDRGWQLFGAGDFDSLIEDYTDDMTFIMPGQNDVLEGRTAFRTALDRVEQILPPGFEVTGLKNTEGENAVVSIVEWKSEKVPKSQLAILFKFKGTKIYEERWFLDTQQWRDAF